MLNNTIKNLLSIILVLCILLQGCKSPQTTTPPPETITPKISVQEQPELKEIVFSHLKELSKEELEQEIQECEEYFSHQYDFDQDKSPEEQLALIGGIIFSPFIHVYYIQAKFEYIEKYGTRKQ